MEAEENGERQKARGKRQRSPQQVRSTIASVYAGEVIKEVFSSQLAVSDEVETK